MIEFIREYNFQWAFVLGVCLIFGCSYLYSAFGWAAACTGAFFGMSALWVWAYKDNRYVALNPYDQMALRYFASDSFLKAAIILTPLMCLSKNRTYMRMVGEGVSSLFFVISSLWIIVNVFLGCYIKINECSGISGNPSICVGLMVAMLPIFVHSWSQQWVIILLAAIAVVASKSSISIGLFTVYTLIWFFPKKVSLEKLMISGLIFLTCAGSSYLLLGKELLNDSDRFNIWSFMMKAWAMPANILAGTGWGTYHVFSINLQNYGQSKGLNLGNGYWWNTLHNDPLQVLFECGIIGLLLFSWTYFTALFRSFKIDSRLSISIVLYGLYMTLDPALHNPFPALFGAWLFVYALRKPETEEILL